MHSTMAKLSNLKPLTIAGARSISTLTSSSSILSSDKLQRQPLPVSSTIDIENGSQIFSSESTTSLLRSLAILSAMAVETFVDAGTAVLRSPAVMGNAVSREVVMRLVKGSVYRQFCAGEGEEEVERSVRDLWERKGLRGILDYGIEDAGNGEVCDRNLKGFLSTRDIAAKLPSPAASVCIKITALCPLPLLEKASNLLRWQHKHPSFNIPWRRHSFPILANSSPLYHTLSVPESLTDDELIELQSAFQRVSQICRKCSESNIPVIIDAEYLSVQPAIDYFTYSMTLEFNKDDRTIIYGTIQSYLRDAKERMVKAVEAAKHEGVSIGVKLVRGAYLTRENKLAESLGVTSPIHSSIQATHNCYNSCASFMLETVRKRHGAVILATHNVDSGKLAAAKAEELGIEKQDERLQFAQLMGMAEGLSLGLRNAGFQVSKHMPFGAVDQVIPYLLRRAEENRGMLSSATLDRKLIRKELIKRLTGGAFGSKD